MTETGFIYTDEIVTYLLLLDKRKPNNVTANLIASHGNPDLFVKVCPNSDCSVTRQEIVGRIHDENFIGISNEIGNDRIVF